MNAHRSRVIGIISALAVLLIALIFNTVAAQYRGLLASLRAPAPTVDGLARLSEFTVPMPPGAPAMPGQVYATASLPADRVAVLHGLTGYGPDFFVTVLDGSTRVSQVPIGFAARLLASGGGAAYYATVNARLGKVASDGARVWERVLMQQPTSIAASNDGAVAIGDRRGGVTVVDTDGAARPRATVSRFPIARAGFSADGRLVIAADSRDVFHLLDVQGRRLCSAPGGGRTTVVSAFLPEGNDILAIHTDGAVERVRLGDSSQHQRAAAYLRWLLPVNAALALLLLGALVTGSARLTAQTASVAQRLWQGRVAYALLLPTFALLVVFSYYPVVTAFLYAFTTFSLSSPMRFVGLDNFREMLHDPYVWVGVKNMLLFTLTGLVKTLTVPLLVAELVFWLASDRLRQALRTFFVIPAVVPGLVGVLLWKMIYDPGSGLINATLKAIGLDRFVHAWLAEEHLAFWSIVFAGFPWVNVFALPHPARRPHQHRPRHSRSRRDRRRYALGTLLAHRRAAHPAPAQNPRHPRVHRQRAGFHQRPRLHRRRTRHGHLRAPPSRCSCRPPKAPTSATPPPSASSCSPSCWVRQSPT